MNITVGEVLFLSRITSPVGPVELASSSAGLVALSLGERAPDSLAAYLGRVFPGFSAVPAGERHAEAEREIEEYFQGRRRVFGIPLDPRGTPFQRAVWEMVARIPFGATSSYGEIAHLVGKPRAVRAVGAANGANPLPLVIPCHRVVGSDGSLTGYGGGIPVKRWLLAHEGAFAAGAVQMRLFRNGRAPGSAYP